MRKPTPLSVELAWATVGVVSVVGVLIGMFSGLFVPVVLPSAVVVLVVCKHFIE